MGMSAANVLLTCCPSDRGRVVNPELSEVPSVNFKPGVGEDIALRA